MAERVGRGPRSCSSPPPQLALGTLAENDKACLLAERTQETTEEPSLHTVKMARSASRAC